MTNTFLSTLKNRRTYYSLSGDISISRQRIREIVEQALLVTPSAFNSQSARVVLLFGEHHNKLWDIVKETLRAIVPEAAFAKTAKKIDGFAAAAGTVLYFDDTTVVQSLQEQFPSYKDNFPIWAEQANGMLQNNIWTALEAEGLGASLQHYNPLIDARVEETWSISPVWLLVAQMPFGASEKHAEPKEARPLEARKKVFR
jgi:predicted oxidoreductase (fatty acid repression mutant protein)